MSDVISFGDRRADTEYVIRPSAYVVAHDAALGIATVRTPVGHFLPGGGIEHGESPRDAVVREALEECGLTLDGLRSIRGADQYAYSITDDAFYLKRSAFWLASVVDVGANSEPDHELVWLGADEAVLQLTYESHRWAVGEGAAALSRSAGGVRV